MKNKGFTLIEMLVVIAVIGILSATVLTALGPARNKAKDTRIISALSQVMSVAETYYSGTYTGLTVSNPSQMGPLTTDITTNSGNLVVNVSGDGRSYAAYSALASDSTKYYCVDSAGTSKSENSNPGAATTCP
jgi:general secretion pathway protein G